MAKFSIDDCMERWESSLFKINMEKLNGVIGLDANKERVKLRGEAGQEIGVIELDSDRLTYKGKSHLPNLESVWFSWNLSTQTREDYHPYPFDLQPSIPQLSKEYLFAPTLGDFYWCPMIGIKKRKLYLESEARHSFFAYRTELIFPPNFAYGTGSDAEIETILRDIQPKHNKSRFKAFQISPAFVLQSKKADCTGYSTLAVAYKRMHGIPARYFGIMPNAEDGENGHKFWQRHNGLKWVSYDYDSEKKKIINGEIYDKAIETYIDSSDCDAIYRSNFDAIWGNSTAEPMRFIAGKYYMDFLEHFSKL